MGVVPEGVYDALRRDADAARVRPPESARIMVEIHIAQNGC